MKDFFSNKLNIFLTFLLLAIVGVCVWFAFTLFGNPFDKSIVAANFSGMNKSEVEQWIADNKLDETKYNYSFQYDETIEQNYVVYQSVKEGEVIKDSLTIVYSNGKDPNAVVDVTNEINNMSADEARNWFAANGYTNVNFLYETSDTFEFGKFINVNPSSATKSEVITVTYSLGKNINDIVTTVPNFSSYTENDIKEWAKQYAIDLSIKYEEHDIAKEGEFLSQSIAADKEIKGGQSIIVTLSSGKGDGNSKTIPDTLLGITENDFIAKLKELGFTNLSKSNITYYAESIEKGNIYSYDDGNFNVGKTINYALCEGKYTFDAKDFNDKTKAEAEKTATSLKNRNARVDGKSLSIEFVKGDKNDEKAGITYDCAANKNVITCKYYDGTITDTTTGKTATIPGSYLYLSEKEFLAKLDALGFKKVSKIEPSKFSETIDEGCVWEYEDGTFDLGKTIKYRLSAGKYSFNANEFNGISKEDATNKANEYKNRNADQSKLSINFKDGEANSSNAGKTYDCSYTYKTISCKLYTGGNSAPAQVNVSDFTGKSVDEFKNWCSSNGLNANVSEQYSDGVASGVLISQSPASGSVDKGSTINAVVSKGKETVANADMLSLSMITQNYKGDNFDDTKNKVVSYLNSAGFNNVTVQETTSTKPLYSIVSITVNGSNHAGAASYPTNSAIVVTIVSANP